MYTTAEAQSNWLVMRLYPFDSERSKKLLAVIITDQEYPIRPAFSLLSRLLDDFTAKVPQSSFNNSAAISFPDITTYVQKYQDPRQADTIMRVQQELDETKIVLVRVQQPLAVYMCAELLLRSIKQSNQFYSEERNWIVSWRDRMRSPLQAKRSIRLLRRYMLMSFTALC